MQMALWNPWMGSAQVTAEERPNSCTTLKQKGESDRHGIQYFKDFQKPFYSLTHSLLIPTILFEKHGLSEGLDGPGLMEAKWDHFSPKNLSKMKATGK